jgi:phospholipase A-2-activating protein
MMVYSHFYYSVIRVWTLGGDVVYTLSAGKAFIYSLSVLPSGNIVSCGEDYAVSVWRGEHFLCPFTHLPLN